MQDDPVQDHPVRGGPDGDGHVRRRRLGAGMSGEVWLEERPAGDGPDRVASKLFVSAPLADAVHLLLSGAPNPYRYDEDAVRAALARRRVLRALVRAWLGDRLVVADGLDVAYDDEARAFRLDTEYAPGHPVRLLHPLRLEDPGLDVLRREVLGPLQERAAEAGLDGVVWQAGRGNPLGITNVLQGGDGPDGRPVFVLVDAESGVPALFPLDPRALLGFYLPRSWHHRRPLVDDVDVPRLRAHLAAHADDLRAALGAREWDRLGEEVDRLEHHQDRWRSRGRTERGVLAARTAGSLTADEAAWYRRRPLRWAARQAGRALTAAVVALTVTLPVAVARRLGRVEVGTALRRMGQFLTSQQYRTRVARDHVARRVEHWRDRGQLSDADADRLLAGLDDDGTSTFLTDFGAHLGLKATFQLLELTVFAALVAAGVLPLWVLAVLVALDGLLYRTAWTLWACAREAAARRPPPWVALLVGLAPLVGSLAFPAQIVHSAAGREELVARFVVVDLLTRLGARVPVWGGEDSLTEHVANRLGARLVTPR